MSFTIIPKQTRQFIETYGDFKLQPITDGVAFPYPLKTSENLKV